MSVVIFKVMVMTFNATFNNISVLLVQETGVSGENGYSHDRKVNWLLT
jgi:hypothetical protein